MKELDLQFNLMARKLLDTTKSNTNAGLMISFLKHSPNVNKDTINTLLLALKARFPDVKYIQALTSESFSDEQGLKLNTKAPDINLKDIDGTAIDTKTISYKYLLIDFWASWCKPCREESPYLIKTYEKFQQYGFQILSLSIDANVNKWKEAIQTDGTSKFLQVIDTDAAKSVYLQLYKISSIPYNLLIDKNGIIVAKNLRGDELYKTIAKLILSN